MRQAHSKHGSYAATIVIAGFIHGNAAMADVINVPTAPAPTIQVAINISSSGDEIIVAPGTYFESLDLGGKTLTIRSSDGPDVTTIDGLGQFTQVIAIDSGEGADTLIEGFTIRRGEAVGAFPNDRGGGIYIDGASATVRDCVIKECTARYGGGFFVDDGTAIFENCTILNNTAVLYGGGGYCNPAGTTMLTDCVVESNVAQNAVAGGLRVVSANVTITRCAFLNNVSIAEGGAIEVETTSQVTIYDSWFEGNFCGDGGVNGRGGAIHCAGSSSNTTIYNTVFYNNSCTRFGGALYAARPITSRNCTFYGNATDSGSEGMAAATQNTMYNCLAWNNGTAPMNASNTVQYSCIEGGYAGTGNLGADSGDEPLFVDAANGDLRLLEGSPGIDAGSSVLVPDTLAEDYDGSPRVVNGLESGATGNPVHGYFVDMGAYEFQPVGTGPDPCPADTNGDGVIDVTDLLNLLAAWGSCF